MSLGKCACSLGVAAADRGHLRPRRCVRRVHKRLGDPRGTEDTEGIWDVRKNDWGWRQELDYMKP